MDLNFISVKELETGMDKMKGGRAPGVCRSGCWKNGESSHRDWERVTVSGDEGGVEREKTKKISYSL